MKTSAAIFALGLTVLVAALPSTAAENARVKPTQPARISMGQEVKLADYVVPGKTTIFDFTSPFCPTCMAIAPKVEKLHATRADIVLVSVDINRPGVKDIDWESPVAKQYKIEGTPQFKIFGPNGKLIAEGKKAQAMIDEWIK